MVWARGRGPLFRLEGLNVTGAARSGVQRTQLLKNTAPTASHPHDTWQHDIINSEVRVPGEDTTYWCRLHRLPAALRTKHHVVQVGAHSHFYNAFLYEGLPVLILTMFRTQYEAVIQPGNEPLVHHIEVFHCEAPHTQVMPEYQGPCFSPERPEVTKVCKRVLAAWAMGALPFSYPEVPRPLKCSYGSKQ